MKTIFALCACAFICSSASELSPTDNLRARFYQLEKELWRNVTEGGWSQASADIELTKAFEKFDEQVRQIPRPPTQPLSDSWLWSRAAHELGTLESLYGIFVEFAQRQATPGGVPAPVREWLDLAEDVLIRPEGSASQAVKRLQELLKHGDLFRASLQNTHPDLCELQLSPHQLLYDMYNTISLVEIKGYAMMQFSWMLLRIYGKGNFTQEASLTRQRYTDRTMGTAAAARAALAHASRDLYRCDPPRHVEGETYAQVTKLLQGYIENEVNMNPEGTCRENCAAYNLAKKYDCFKDLHCSNPCNGRILECQYIDSDMWVCPAKRGSTRRYDWIKYENERTLGKFGSCMYETKVDSWWRWLFWHCSYCMCLCDEIGPKSDRYFSLRETISDVNLNKVVTGLRLVKLGRVFHLQVSQGTLGQRGAIVQDGWVPVTKFDPSDRAYKNESDYHTLTYERRAIDLDELEGPQGNLLTGARFRMIGAHLHFEIRVTPFNYTTGRLAVDKSQWISNDNTEGADKPRSRLELYKPDIPTRTRVDLQVESRHDQYVEFTYSDLEADAAQSTVPFIDIQPVETRKGASLISGAGLIHRGARGNGGFIAPKLFTYDYTRHIHAEPPPLSASFQNDGDDSLNNFVSVIN